MNKRANPNQARHINRREFIKLSTGSVAVLASGISAKNVFAKGKRRQPKPKNIVLIFTDQQHIDTIAAGGCPHVHTPALDRLKKSGVSFTQSYTPNPLCSPARSAVFTGRTSSECGVHINGLSIRSDIPNLGQWFTQHTDYETFYAGKWHLPRTYTLDIPGFKVIHTGIGGFGYLCDTAMSRACEGFLLNRPKSKPFLLVASFMQPHDICEWLRLNLENPDGLRYPQLDGRLPELPDNFNFDKNEPKDIKNKRLNDDPFRGKSKWNRQHWRYYRYSYYRNIEHLDAEIGRILRILDDSGYIDDTLIVLTSDHGEGMGHHQLVRKKSFYDEASRVPLLFSWPGYIPQNKTETFHLVSGLDLMPTLCDYAGIKSPQNMRGRSLRSIIEGNVLSWGHIVVTELSPNTARMVRTQRYKYITYKDDRVEQLFDMMEDPGETKNLATVSKYASTLTEHLRILKDWEAHLDVAPNVTNKDAWWYKT